MKTPKITKEYDLFDESDPLDIGELVPSIMNMEDWKLNIINKLRIPKEIKPYDILKVLIGMKANESNNGHKSVIGFSFKDDTPQVIMDIIMDAVYSKIGINQSSLLHFEIISSKGKPIGESHECSKKYLLETFQNVLFEYLGCHIKLNGNLDIKTIINKKAEEDDSCLKYLIINGDFHCSKYSKVFPFSVSGCFDCSGLGKDYIDKDTKFPEANTIDCSFSVKSLDVLVGKLPKNLRTLIVEPKFIRKNSLATDHEYRKTVLEFMEMYPELEIIDTSGKNVRDILEQIVDEIDLKQQKKQEQKKADAKPQDDKPTVGNKVIGYDMEIKEIAALCHSYPEFAGLSDGYLLRMVRLVLSDQRKNGVNKYLKKRADGAVITCVDVESMPMIRTDLSSLMSKDKSVDEKEIVVEQKQPIVAEVEKVENVLHPIEIKKYIKLNQLKDVKKSSGETNTICAMKSINEINLDPLEMQFQGPVRILKNGIETVSDTVKKESGCCLVQSTDSSNHDDTKRLVWSVADGPNGLIIVCMGFVDNYNTKRASNRYVELRKKAYKKQTFSEKELAGYIDVNDFLDDVDNGDNFPPLASNILTQKITDVLSHKM